MSLAASPDQSARAFSKAPSVSDRKRVCRACDRCRHKKSKCGGSTPCSRCRKEDVICVFGDRIRSQDKIYPKGYAEMLEHHQILLISGLKGMYYRAQHTSAWEGPCLHKFNKHPLVHDILSELNLLMSHDDSGEMITFEEDCNKLRSRMALDDPTSGYRKRIASSGPDHSYHERLKTAPRRAGSPVQSKLALFTQSSNSPSMTLPLFSLSPTTNSNTCPQQTIQSPVRQSPAQLSPMFDMDQQCYELGWKQASTSTSDFYYSSCGRYSYFDITSSPTKPRGIPLDSYHQFSLDQAPMAGDNVSSMPDMSASFNLNMVKFDSGGFI